MSHFLDPSLTMGMAPARAAPPPLARPDSGLVSDILKANNVTAAHFVTVDFVNLTDRELWSKGCSLEDRTHRTSIKVFSLIELEQGVDYRTQHGNTLVRVDRKSAVLAGRIKLSVDLADSSVRSPHSSEDIGGAGGASAPNAAAGGDGSRLGATAGAEEQSAVIGSVLQHVQALRGEVEAESLFELLRTLHALPANDGGWLDSFLELDGMQALLDVLSLSQQQQPAPTTPRDSHPISSSPSSISRGPSRDGGGGMPHSEADAADEADTIQGLCVNCLSLLVRRRAALDQLLCRPQAVTCVVAALHLRHVEAQGRIAEILLRIALLPAGAGHLLEAWTPSSPSHASPSSCVLSSRRAPSILV